MENKVVLSKDIEEQGKFLSEVKSAINIVLQSIVNARVSLIMEKKKNNREEWWQLVDVKDDWQRACGSMKVCFKRVVLRTWSIWWDDTDESCVIQFNFDIELTRGGSNSLDICRLRVYRDGFIERID